MKPNFSNKFNNKLKNTEKISKNTEKTKLTENNAVQNPITNPGNQIINGYFVNEKSYKQRIIERINMLLYCVLGVLITFCLVCYYFVSCKEVKLNQISRATLELNYENDELQNKVDSLQSYYNIDKAVSKTNILERAKQVVEVDAKDLPAVNLKNSSGAKHAFVVSY